MRSSADIRIATLAIWLIPLLWTVNNLQARVAPGVVDPYTLGLMRWGFAGLVLGLVVRRELWRERRQPPGPTAAPSAAKCTRDSVPCARRCP